MSKEKKLTSASGVPYYYNEDSLSAGPHTEDGPFGELVSIFISPIGLDSQFRDYSQSFVLNPRLVLPFACVA